MTASRHSRSLAAQGRSMDLADAATGHRPGVDRVKDLLKAHPERALERDLCVLEPVGRRLCRAGGRVK
jgi:hypothetical protein